MAQGYVPIQTITLTGTASSIDFVNIPQNYTDLKLLISSRNNDAGFFGNILLTINDSVSSYTNTFLQANGSSIGGGQVAQMIGDMNTSATTSNLFNNIEVYIPNYSGSTNKFFSADSIGENNGSQAYIMLMANTWAVTSAITKISLTNRNGGVSFVANTSVTLYGIGAHRASGGTITADSQYTYHTFTSSGTFTALEKIKGAEALIVAGGGGGGYYYAGGGGAGGVVLQTCPTFSAGTSYSVIVGAGGASAGTTIGFGGDGGDSFFNIVKANGGGGGGYWNSTGFNGRNGGSGGGGGMGTGSGNTTSGGTATQGSFAQASGYGNNGGGGLRSGSFFGGGGGGGASSVGGSASGSIAGNGGNGIYSPSWTRATNTGENGYFAGGGGGGAEAGFPGSGGVGGGGRGALWSGGASVAGIANTGGGGGGSGGQSSAAAGGSGIVIIRYQN